MASSLRGRLAGGGSEWLRLIAHELTHVSQFELAGGEGRAEQWLAEGMAEHVAFQVLERLKAARAAGVQHGVIQNMRFNTGPRRVRASTRRN